jgi:hypothetical protein
VIDDATAILSASFQRAPRDYGVFAMVFVTLNKAWPVLSEQATEAKAKLRKEKNDYLDDCKARLDRMSARVDAMGKTINNLKAQMSGVLSAYRVSEAKRREIPTRSISSRRGRS